MIEGKHIGVRLTKRIVDQTDAATKPVFVWDSQLRGFGLRVEPTGTRTFVLRYRMRHLGPSVPKRFFTVGRYGPLTVEQARDRAKAVLAEVNLGRDPAATLAKDKAEQTFGQRSTCFCQSMCGRNARLRRATAHKPSQVPETYRDTVQAPISNGYKDRLRVPKRPDR